jgi:hypothetical protein
MVKRIFYFSLAAFLLIYGYSRLAGAHTMNHEQGTEMQEVPGGIAMHKSDVRESIGLTPMMKIHQLENMRTHLKGVQEIIGGLAEGDFASASTVAHEKLGLTAQMAKMCDIMPNPAFRDMALAFHRASDELGDIIKTKDTQRSLSALQGVLSRCTTCHDQYRQ